MCYPFLSPSFNALNRPFSFSISFGLTRRMRKGALMRTLTKHIQFDISILADVQRLC